MSTYTWRSFAGPLWVRVILCGCWRCKAWRQGGHCGHGIFHFHFHGRKSAAHTCDYSYLGQWADGASWSGLSRGVTPWKHLHGLNGMPPDGRWHGRWPLVVMAAGGGWVAKAPKQRTPGCYRVGTITWFGSAPSRAEPQIKTRGECWTGDFYVAPAADFVVS